MQCVFCLFTKELIDVMRVSPPGASGGAVELLPAPSSSANWTVGLPTDNGHDSDQVFEFNGTQAVRVPAGVAQAGLSGPFTISLWMRHGPGAPDKEAVLCSSDRTGTPAPPSGSEF